MDKQQPIIGIVGDQGAYGRWLTRFFRERMGLQVLGRDPANADSLSELELIARSDVLLFSAPIRHTPQLIEDYVRLANGSEAGKLWLDVTSIKSPAVAAMLQSKAEVVGLHPMTAPPKSPTLKGRVMVVCEARLHGWRSWFERFIAALEAQCVEATPEQHDRITALVQAMVHASHLAQANVIADYANELGGLQGLLPFRTASFEMDAAIMSRILSLNPSIYEDIQFGNPYVLDMLDRLVVQLQQLRSAVEQGNQPARDQFRHQFFGESREALGVPELEAGSYNYERIGYLLADLADTQSLSIHLPEDRPGSLRALLHVFERHGLSIASLHSSRTPSGDVHFRLGFDSNTDPVALLAAAAEVDVSGIGRVLGQD